MTLEQFDDIFLLDQKSSSDERGEFIKFFDDGLIRGKSFVMKQQNFVTSLQAGTFRGLHFQEGARAEAKIFRTLQGKMQLVFFDTRPASPTFQQSGSVILTDPAQAVFIPRGYATGYLTLEPDTQVLYMSDEEYAPEAERGISILDPLIQHELEIEAPILSDKDSNWPDWS
jgi:dTDP-4-dehydrorhamnose 3,5-epimerase